MTEKERQTDRDRHRDRQTETETDRQRPNNKGLKPERKKEKNLEQFYQSSNSDDYDPSPANVIVCSSVFLNSLLLLYKHIAVAPCRTK